MVRITTNGTLFNYRSSLMKNTNRLNDSMMKVMSGRNFSTYAADPAGATRAFRVHSSLNAVRTHADNNQTALSKFETAWNAVEGTLDGLADKLGLVPALSGLNGTNLENLDTQAQVLRSGAEGVIQSMNSKYGDDYLFAGADNRKPPFGMEDGFVTYRGIRVDDPGTLAQENTLNLRDADGNLLTNEEVLRQWAEADPLYVDVGLGFELDDQGKVLPSSAFDAAISGIDLLGYGVDADGDPRNLASVMLRLADAFDACASAGGTPSQAQLEEAGRLMEKLNGSRDAMIDAHAQLDAKARFLNNNDAQLKSGFDALNAERAGIEDADPADAIMELVWAQTCYNAALQVGAQVVPQSLMDYLN